MKKQVTDREVAYRALVCRRTMIADECRQLKRDIDSYNASNPYGWGFVVPSFDFTGEVTKAEAPEPKPERLEGANA